MKVTMEMHLMSSMNLSLTKLIAGVLVRSQWETIVAFQYVIL